MSGRTPASRIRAGDAVLFAGFALLAVSDLWRYWRAEGAPSGDVALIALRTRDVPGDLPLVGVFSRYGWNHPGPWQLWLSRPFQAVFGDAGLYLAAWLLGVVALGATLYLLRRWASTGTALVGLVTFASVVTAGGAAYLADPWNPTVGAIPVVLAVVAAWATGEGWRWGPTVAVGAASFAVGAHVGAALPALVAVSLAAVWGVARVRDARFGAGWLGVAAAAGVLAWLPALVDQVAGDGHLWRIVRFAGSDDAGERYGLERSMGATLRLLGWSGAWRRAEGQQVTLTGERTSALSLADVAVPLALAVAGLAAARWCSHADRRLLAATWLAVLTAVVSFATIARPAYPYLAAWSAPVVALVWAATFGPWLERARHAMDTREVWWRWAPPATAGALTAVLVLAPTGQADQWRTEMDVGGLARAVDGARAGRAVLVCGRDPYLGAYVSALLNELDRRDVPVRSRERPAHVVGAERVARPGEDAFAVTLITDRAELARLDDAGVQPLARSDELAAAERARSAQLVADLSAALDGRLPGPETNLLRVAVEDGGAGLLRAAAEAAPELAGDLAELAELRPGVEAAVLTGCV